MAEVVTEPKNKIKKVQLSPPRHQRRLARFQMVDPSSVANAMGRTVRQLAERVEAKKLINDGSDQWVVGRVAAIAPDSSPKQTAPGFQPLLKYLANALLSRIAGV